MAKKNPVEEININKLTYEQRVEKLDEILKRLDNSKLRSINWPKMSNWAPD